VSAEDTQDRWQTIHRISGVHRGWRFLVQPFKGRFQAIVSSSLTSKILPTLKPTPGEALELAWVFIDNQAEKGRLP
jgi:hypothetical protein